MEVRIRRMVQSISKEADGLFSSGSESDGEHGGEVNVYVGHVGHRSCHAATGVMFGLHC